MSSPLAHDPGPATHRDLDPQHALPAGNTVTDPAHLLPAHATETPVKGSWLRKIILLLLVAGVIAFAVWRIRSNNSEAAVAGNRAAAAANRPVPVLVAAVQQRTVPVYLTALGTVTPYNTVTLHSRIDGQLLKVNFTEGQTVKQGQLLLQIDPRPYQAALAQAKGQLTKDVAAAKMAQDQAQRYTALYQAGVVSKESQQTQISTAGQATGSIESDNAAIQAANVNLSYTSIYSPINGVVGLRAVDVGNIVHASDANGLVTITQIHPISVIFTLPEDQLPQVQQAMKGTKLQVEAYDRSDSHKIATGTLLTIDNQIDTTTGTAKLKAVFDNSDDALFPNQFVNVRLIVQQRQNAIVVPSSAIQSGTQGSFLFVVRDGAGKPAGGRRGGADAKPAGDAPAAAPSADGQPKAGERAQGPPKHVQSVPVHVDLTQGASVILASGAVQLGDKVVIDGQEKLSDGSNVSPQEAPARAATTTSGGIGASGGKMSPADGTARKPGSSSESNPAPRSGGNRP